MDTALSPQALLELHETGTLFLLIDVRQPEEYQAGNLGGQNIPLDTLPTQLDALNRNQCIIIHCQRGVRSAQALDLLMHAGFNEVAHLTGGLEAWLKTYGPRYPWRNHATTTVNGDQQRKG